MASLAGTMAPVPTTPRSVTTDGGMEQRMNTEEQMNVDEDMDTLASVDQSCTTLLCLECPPELPDTQESTNHVRDHNSPRSSDGSVAEDEWSCRICNIVFNSATSLDHHILSHVGERPFKCGYCGVAFTTNGHIRRHMKVVHGSSSSNSCTDSDASSESGRRPVRKRRNLEEFNNNNVFKRKSPECVKVVRHMKRKRNSLLINNSRTEVKNDQVRTRRTHSCPVCDGQYFETRALLEAHLERTHPTYPATCDICNLEFEDFRVLNHHRSMGHQPNRSIDSPTRSLRNSVVGFNDLTFVDFSSGKFPTIARAVCEKSLHRPASGEVARFQCCKCLRAFPCRTALESHETDCGNQSSQPRSVVNDQSKRNDFFAGLDLQNKVALAEAKEGKDLADIESILSVTSGPILQNFSRSDASTPDNQVKMEPSQPGSSSSSRTTLTENHEEEVQDAFSKQFRRMKLRGEFPCRLCPAVFPNLRALKGHNRVHILAVTGTVYPCNMCPYTSTDKATVTKHLRSHNGDRPYECSLCKYAFTTKANCERHLRNRHGKLTREDVKRSIIYHSSEDPLNDQTEVQPSGVRDDTRRPFVYPTEREESGRQSSTTGADGRSEIRVIDEAKLRHPELPAQHPLQSSHFDTSEVFHRAQSIQPLDIIQRHLESLVDNEKPQDLACKQSFVSHNDHVQDNNSSDESESPLVNEANLAMHQRLPDVPMNLQTAVSNVSCSEDMPLDLSMDALDLRKKSKVEESTETVIPPEEARRSEKDIYNATNQLLLTQALLKNGQNPQATSLQEALQYANAHLLYQNFGTFPPAIGAGLQIPPYLFAPHLFSQEFAMKSRLPNELIRGLQCSGGSMVEPQVPRGDFAASFSQSMDASCHSASEDADYAPKRTSPKLPSKVATSREKLGNSQSSVKMVIKNGVLMPKQKQRRYRTERPFGCDYCSARFTLRSNMERHVKQQHPQHWSQKQRGGHSTRGRPPTNPPTLLHSLGQPTAQSMLPHCSNILPKVDHSSSVQNYGKHSISDQVKYAILAQQLKGNKTEENDSEEELVIDEARVEDESVESRAHDDAPQPLSLLRGKLEDRSDFNKDNILKQHVNDFSKEYLVQLQEQHLERLKRYEDAKVHETSADDKSDKDIKDEQEGAVLKGRKKSESEDAMEIEQETEKAEDGVVDLASVSRLLDNASQQHQQFQPQDLSDEEGLVASTSEGNSGSDDKSDSGNSESAPGKKKKKKSAYSLAPNRVSCPYCHRKFPWSSSLRRHILTHTGQKPYNCRYCPLLFTTKSNCDRHLLRKHVNGGSKSQARSSAASASPRTSTASVNSNAFAMRNVPERPYKCNQCPSSTFSTLGNLKKHRSSKHRTSRQSSRSMSPLSNPRNSPTESLKQNDQSGYDSPSSSIEEPSRTSSSSAEESHKATPNTSTSTDTPQSAKTSPESGSTASSCSSELPFKCHLCDGSFAERHDCLEHIRHDHTSEYKLLLTKGALDMAAVTETHPEEQQQPPQQHCEEGEGQRGKFPDYSNRKVVCAFCMRRFWSAEDLRRHMRTHTGERPFSCDICRRRFTLKHSMLRHRKKHDSIHSSIYTGTSGDEEGSSTTATVINNNNNAAKTQEANYPSTAPGEATPVRFGSHEKRASLSGKLANLQNNSVEGEDEVDLISNLLDIRDKTFIDRILQASPDDAAKLLGVKRANE